MAEIVVNGIAKQSTIHLNSGLRALGRMAEINLGESMDDPLLDAQCIKDLGSDTFWEYYTTPFVKAPEDIPAERNINRRLLDWTTQSPSWQQSKSSAHGSMILSAVSSGLLTQHLVSDENVRKALDEQKNAEEEQKKAEEAQAEANEKQEHGDAEGAAKAQQQADSAQKKSQQHSQNANDQLDKIQGNPFGQAIRANAVKKAKEGTDEAKAIITGWGMEDGENSTTNPSEILDVLKNYKDFLTKITPLIGRVKGIAMGVKSQTKQKGNVVVEDGYTQKLNNIFPSEIALLRSDAHPALRASKMGEYCDRGLIGMCEGNEAINEGGLVIAVDESGSMEGDRLTRAKALAIGLAEAAKENKQPYAIFSFSNSTNDVTVTDKDGFVNLLKWSQGIMGGGTSYDAALKKGMNIINGLGDKASKTDFVLISDGECAIQDSVAIEWGELKALYGTRLIFLGVDLSATYTQQNYSGNKGITTIDKLATTMLDMKNTDNLGRVAEKLSEALVRPQIA